MAVWYLLGWSEYLQERKQDAADFLAEAARLYDIVGCERPDMLAHVHELLRELEAAGIRPSPHRPNAPVGAGGA